MYGPERQPENPTELCTEDDRLRKVFGAAQEKHSRFEYLRKSLNLSERDLALLADSENPYRLAAFSPEDRQHLAVVYERVESKEHRDMRATLRWAENLGKAEEKEVRSAQTFEALFAVLRRIEELPGTKEVQSAKEIIDLIQGMRQRPETFSPEKFTRSFGVREKLVELFSREQTLKR